MIEQWHRWKPVENLSAKYDIDAMSTTPKSCGLILSAYKNKNEIVQVTFEHAIKAYRSTYETFRYKLILDLDKKHSTSFYGDWVFFKVENSTYISWFLEQSSTNIPKESLIHFSFIAMESVTDIIATEEPKVELI